MFSFLAGVFLLQATYVDLYNDGQRLLDLGKPREAEVQLRESLSQNPGHAPSYKALGEAYAKLNMIHEAIGQYMKAVEISPNDMQARRRLAELYAWSGNHDKSIVTYRDALEMDPENLPLKNGLATVLRWSHRYDEAERLYSDVLAGEPENHEALKGLAKTYSMLGDFPSSIAVFSKALASYPDDAELHKELGTVYAWQKDYTKGIEHIKKAVDLSPSYAEAFRTMGDVYSWMKAYDLSAEAYKKAAALEPDNLENHLSLARLYRQMEKKDMAENAVKAALRINPSDAHALDMLREIRGGDSIVLADRIGDIVESAAFLFVLVALIVAYRRRRRVILRRHKLYLYFVSLVLPGLFVLALVSFLYKSSFEGFMDYALIEDIVEAVLFLTLGASLMALLWTERRSRDLASTVVLAIGAHPDDIELGCAGFIMKAKDSGAKVYGLTITRGEKGAVNAGQRADEIKKASRFMELDDYWVLEFPDTMLSGSVSPVKDAIEAKVKETGATLVLTHTPIDIHSDHQAVFEATKVAARNVSILCYEDVSTPREFVPNYFVDISPYVEDKLKLVSFHRTQGAKTYMDPEVIKGRAAHRGLQANVQYAGAYQTYKLLK